ncbi:MAG: NUDIX hydrolase [Patescibacteria group bacterium]
MSIKPYTKDEKRAWHNSLPARPCAAAVVAVNEKGEMLVVKASYKHYWSLPGGVVDESESPRAAAARELFEETAIKLQEKDIQLAGVTYRQPHDGHKDSVYFLFKASVDSSVAFKPDGEEIETIEWLAPKEFRKRFTDYHTHLVLATKIAQGHNSLLYEEG